jgi:hypothetical protein
MMQILSPEDFVYSRIGMALISAERVEYLTRQLLELLTEFDKDVYGITTSEFLEKSTKSAKAHKTLGSIFKLLKLNPKFIIEDELDEYLKKRNVFVHYFWERFLLGQNDDQGKLAVEFCYDFGKHSDRMSSFFKGFLYMLSLRHVKDRDHLDIEMRRWGKDFDYFISTVTKKELL